MLLAPHWSKARSLPVIACSLLAGLLLVDTLATQPVVLSPMQLVAKALTGAPVAAQARAVLECFFLRETLGTPLAQCPPGLRRGVHVLQVPLARLQQASDTSCAEALLGVHQGPRARHQDLIHNGDKA